MTEETEHETIPVRRGRVDSIDLYEVTEDELQELERGGEASNYLNFALALISIAISFAIALATTNTTDRQFYVFLIIVVGTALAALIFGVIWWNNRRTVRQLAAKIRARMRQEEGLDTEEDADAVGKETTV
jgi:uncharacterized membrane protein YciS (DUF1049 family)